MRLISTLAALSIVFIPLVSNGQGTKKCIPTSPSSSSVYQEFMRTDLPSKWSTKDFGRLAPLPGEDFQECTQGADIKGFSMLQAKTDKIFRSVGYASKDGKGMALVFEVMEVPGKENTFATKAFNVTGELQFTFTSSNGRLIDYQYLGVGGNAQCSRAVVQGVLTTVGGTLGLGPVGFVMGMSSMCIDLWANDCF